MLSFFSLFENVFNLVWWGFNLERGFLVKDDCQHGDVEFLGTEKAGASVNRYYRCRKCGSVLVLSDENVLYEVKARKD
jgi:hypothetical protein